MANPSLAGKVAMHPEVAAAIGEYVDCRREAGIGYQDVAVELTARGQKITAVKCQELHARWSLSERRDIAKRERRETGLVEEITPAAETAPPEDPEAPEINSQGIAKMIRYIGEDLVERKPQWFPSCRPTLVNGQTWRQIKGAGSHGGIAWIKCAVLILQGEEIIRVYPEHRMRRAYGPESRCNTSMLGSKKPPRWQLYLEVLTLERPSKLKARQRIKEIDIALRRGLMTPTARRLMEKARERAVRMLGEGGEEADAKPRLRMEAVLTRLATIMELYMKGATGFHSGEEIAQATGRTRAAVSAQKLGMVRRDTLATGGRAGFEGLRAAGRHRQRAIAAMQ